jgi:hypothetical protein
LPFFESVFFLRKMKKYHCALCFWIFQAYRRIKWMNTYILTLILQRWTLYLIHNFNFTIFSGALFMFELESFIGCKPRRYLKCIFSTHIQTN